MKTDKTKKAYVVGFQGAKLSVIGVDGRSIFPLTLPQACKAIKNLGAGPKYIYKLVPLMRLSE